jgi:hypothetical protein
MKTPEPDFENMFPEGRNDDGSRDYSCYRRREGAKKIWNDYVLPSSSQIEDLTKERDKAYEKGYSDGRNGLHNSDLTKDVERLKEKVQRLIQNNDLISGQNSGLSLRVKFLEQENDRYREALEEVVNRCNAAGGPDERFMDIIILDIRKYASSALHPLVKEGEEKYKGDRPSGIHP